VSNDLQQFRYDNLIRRVGGIIGPGSKVKEAIPELFPTLDVESCPAELLWLTGWRLAFGGDFLLGAAGETPRIELFNPVGSNKMVTVTDFVAATIITTTLLWTTTSVSFPGTNSPQKLRDTRRGAFEVPSGQIRFLSAAGTTVATNRTRVLPNIPFHFRDDNAIAVLFPGTGLEVGISTVASQLDISFTWRERIIEQSELTGV